MQFIITSQNYNSIMTKNISDSTFLIPSNRYLSTNYGFAIFIIFHNS